MKVMKLLMVESALLSFQRQIIGENIEVSYMA